MTKKICSIVGARPQFIKLAPLSKKIRTFSEEVIIHTGQHFDKEMSDLFFIDLKIPEPDYNLGVQGGDHGSQTGNMLIALEKVIKKEKPDLILIFGDTNSTLAGAVVAAKLLVPVIHIEAGLRSFNRTMPEEINRIIADHTSDYLFAPTGTAMKNLDTEGLSAKSYLTGDIMVDSLLDNLEISDSKSNVLNELKINEEFNLLTLHRPYNVDDPQNLNNILTRISLLKDLIVFPVHPRTRKIIEENNLNYNDNVYITNPLGYLDFIKLEQSAKRIITDSGGIQKEAYILKKPCITLRSETEWIETVEEGWNMLISNVDDIIADKIEGMTVPDSQSDIFGSKVAEKMVKIILDN